MPSPQTQFDEAIRKLGRVLVRAAREQMGKQKWDCAVLDIRISHGGDNRSSKFRIKSGADTVGKIHTPDDADTYIDRLWKLRERVLAKNWHGFLCTAYQDGRCEMTFNYDPDCNDDPTFYDD